jgi:hypothetical protein
MDGQSPVKILDRRPDQKRVGAAGDDRRFGLAPMVEFLSLIAPSRRCLARGRVDDDAIGRRQA